MFIPLKTKELNQIKRETFSFFLSKSFLFPFFLLFGLTSYIGIELVGYFPNPQEYYFFVILTSFLFSYFATILQHPGDRFSPRLRVIEKHLLIYFVKKKYDSKVTFQIKQNQKKHGETIIFSFNLDKKRKLSVYQNSSNYMHYYRDHFGVMGRFSGKNITYFLRKYFYLYELEVKNKSNSSIFMREKSLFNFSDFGRDDTCNNPKFNDRIKCYVAEGKSKKEVSNEIEKIGFNNVMEFLKNNFWNKVFNIALILNKERYYYLSAHKKTLKFKLPKRKMNFHVNGVEISENLFRQNEKVFFAFMESLKKHYGDELLGV